MKEDKRRPVIQANAACTVYLERTAVHPAAKAEARLQGLSLSQWVSALVEKELRKER
jgi:predicted HicB family RNase H-like nuclease